MGALSRFPAEQRLAGLHEQRVPGRGRVHARDHRRSHGRGVSSCVVGGWQSSEYEASRGTRTAARAGHRARPRRSRGRHELRRRRARERVPQALVPVAIVVALYVFVGNSGVISFGHVSFVAVGAFAAGVMTVPVELKPTITPELFSLLGERSVGGNASPRWPSPPWPAASSHYRRHPADAPIGALGGHRHVRGPRRDLQHPQQLDESAHWTA